MLPKHIRHRISLLRILERYLWHTGLTGSTVVFIFLVVKFFVLDVGQVNGRSMETTFIDNETFITNKVLYLFHPPARYEVVQVVEPSQEKLLIKRVIALPGEEVIIRRGKVFVRQRNTPEERELAEPYLKKGTYTTLRGQKDAVHFTVGPDEYFILGDNRPYSIDSRVYGAVPRSRIVGKVIGTL